MTNEKYEAWLNGRALSAVSPEIYISSIRYEPPQLTVQTSEAAKRNGLLLESTKWGAGKVTISFVMHRMPGHIRQRIIQEAAAWAAAGGVLQISDRLGQQLHVACFQPPYVADGCDFRTPMSIVFQAYDRPFWEETQASSLTLPAGTSGSDYLFVPGNAGNTLCEITVTPGSGNTLNTIGIGCGTTVLNFSDLGATNANPLKVRYDDRQIMSIKVGSSSAMGKRTAASADDILMKCGQTNLCSYSANVSVTATFSARGLWL